MVSVCGIDVWYRYQYVFRLLVGMVIGMDWILSRVSVLVSVYRWNTSGDPMFNTLIRQVPVDLQSLLTASPNPATVDPP